MKNWPLTLKVLNKQLKLNENEIIEILLFPCISHAFRILDLNHCFKSSDLDIISVHSNFMIPKKMGGLIYLAQNKYGLKYIVEKLNQFSNVFGYPNTKQSLNVKMFFEPSKALVNMAN